ncbi:M14 metallopeptidase family protein [Pedobacter sp. SYSU D00535]|uniref:M14 metallopeptidase family protein n=1 Tax=Pedobacter sp. SYSU D00535 TaxID=2810308 RepID=UPI001A958C03|nr:M14 metallopeptidase family protein [Pedobacter sp. SYSU D00535]
MRRAALLIFFLLLFKPGFSQKLHSPAQFLGYQPGERFTPHYRVLEYFRHAASVSAHIKLREYGKTYEGRELLVAFLGSAENLGHLEDIRKNNWRLSHGQAGNSDSDSPAIIWLSYNVHGNEAVSTEASMQTLYDLLRPDNLKAKDWLQKTIIVIDPCLNPDGRERYVNFYNSVKNVVPDALPFTREHMEPWPGGRSNHYYFDLNRDWAWQTQLETQQRMALYNSWLPQIHVDFHEQNLNSPYFFAPAAEPFHQDVTPWQREFQKVIGKNNARYFDEKGWLYFTRERFDLLYPSYGDTYPTYNGAVGMTFEQGGAGRAGLAVINREGDTLTLAQRIEHHHTSALSTVESAAMNASQLVAEYQKYFSNSRSKPPGQYKSYVIKAENQEKLKKLANLLTKNGIVFGYGSAKNSRGLNYVTGKVESLSITPQDMVISAYQPRSVLLKVLFEPRTFVSDSVTYDITAWALPYAYGLKAYATKEALKPLSASAPSLSLVRAKVENPVAFAANWNSIADARFLSALLKRNLRVRYSEVPFEANGRLFNAGSLLVTKTGNEFLGESFESTVESIASAAGVSLQPLSSGMAERGPDLGSEKVRYIKPPRVALIAGEESSPLAVGEVWHHFEQELSYPLSIIRAVDFNQADLTKFNVLIFPDGDYPGIASEKLLAWVNDGGKVVSMQSALNSLAGKRGFNISLKGENKEGLKDHEPELVDILKPYANRERESVKNNIPGAIFKLRLDNTHPLAFGFPDYYFTLKLDDKVYNYISEGWNVGILEKGSYVTGFAGAETKRKLTGGLLFGVQESGAGSIVYMAEDPLFRGFWENGKLLFSNAIFMVGQ